MALGRREILLLAGVAAAAAAAGVLVGLRLLPGGNAAANALATASFTDSEGRVRKISEWRGRIVVVNFWATWCPPCLEEIPMLVGVRGSHTEKGLEIVGIAVDNAAKVSEYSRTSGINYPILLADSGGPDLLRRLGNSVGGLPYTVFLDRDGTVVQTKLGALKREELVSILGRLLER